MDMLGVPMNETPNSSASKIKRSAPASAGNVRWTVAALRSSDRRRRDERLTRTGRAEQYGGTVAVFEAITQPAQRGISTGQGEVRRRAHRLTEGPTAHSEMLFVHTVSTVTSLGRIVPLTQKSRPVLAGEFLPRRGPRAPAAGNVPR